MRLLIAMMKHETNTFSPVPTPLARFGNGPGPLYGEAAIRAYRGTGTGLGAYLDLAEREGAEIVLPIAAGAPPSGPVEDAAYEHITDTICEAVAQRRVRRHHARSARRDGHREPGGRRGRIPEAAPRDRPEDPDRRVARHARQPLRRDHRQCDRRHRLSHLPAYRHLRDRQARRRDPAARDPRRGEAGHGLGQRADAAACHAAGHRRSPEQGIAAPLRRDERRGRAWPRASSPASRMPTSPMPG